MSVEVTNETSWLIEPKLFSELGLWVMDQMYVSTHSDLTIIFNEPEPMAVLHERWMNLAGPTDVMSFPMDELRPGTDAKLSEGLLGDIVICPYVAHEQAMAAGHSTIEEMMLLTIHGILHLLGYDHMNRDEERQMFGLQRQLLLTFLATHVGSLQEVQLPQGSPDLLALYERTHASYQRQSH